MIRITRKSKCYGCEACSNACPVGAIAMIADEHGFRYPVVDQDKCVECHKCEKVCPSANWVRTNIGRRFSTVRAINCYNSDISVRRESSSGGVFSLLADKILSGGGYVFGAEKYYISDIRHTCIDDYEDVDKLRFSKYFQSAIGNSYKECLKKLKTGKPVLFVGTPCQVAGLYSFLGKDFDNLYTCDLKCHGVPSTAAFDKFCSSIKETEGSEVVDYYRDKSHGWNPVVFTTVLSDGRKISKEAYDDEFNLCFIKSYGLRPSCYNCQFAYLPRMGDMTLSDNFIEAHHASTEDQREGLSMIALNSEKGCKLFDAIKEHLVFSEYQMKGRAVFGWLSGCKTFQANRDEFMSRYQKEDFCVLIHEITGRKESEASKAKLFLKKLYSEWNKYKNRLKFN
ncbi:MAG: Coenzyme F420 hydrogenase/dehydrogenase, beta subunit C-terminal domain [Ruminococcus sp.]|nr:Coenzyme F420 hydrogenase/dehydrogenase, beta subunit C-terminal domain [Ruminococcus sp.]